MAMMICSISGVLGPNLRSSSVSLRLWPNAFCGRAAAAGWTTRSLNRCGDHTNFDLNRRASPRASLTTRISGGPVFEIQIWRMAKSSSGNELVLGAIDCPRSNASIHPWPSRPPGSDDRLPEERTKKCNHNNPKDKAPRVAATGLVVVGGQPVGIAHAKLLGRPPASQPSPDIDKHFLNLSFSCRGSQTPEGAFGQPPDAWFVAAKRG